jgi:hypothetical protein
MGTLLRGTAVAGNTIVEVKYNNWGCGDPNVTDGVTKFSAALGAAPPGAKTALGIGLGAVVLTKWIESVHNVAAAGLSFILLGNPARRYGGVLNSPDYGGSYRDGHFRNWHMTPVLIPTNTTYTVADLARQYDGLCDYPDGTPGTDAYKLAVRNALEGTKIVHGNYDTVTLGDLENEQLTAGNIVYLLSPTLPLPLAGTAITPSSEQQDKKLRPQIELAYNRVTSPPPYTPPATDPYPVLATVSCAEPDHFYVADGRLTPQPWMQQRRVAHSEAAAGTASFGVTGGGNKSDTVQRVTASWLNTSPIPQLVHGSVTHGGSRVTLQARSRGYLSIWSGIGKGGLPVLTESSRFGVGADQGLGGMLAIGTGFCDAEVRQNSRTFPIAPETVGRLRLEPGEEAVGEMEVRFVTERYESASIDGGDIEAESSFHTGAVAIDLFATPVIDPPV